MDAAALNQALAFALSGESTGGNQTLCALGTFAREVPAILSENARLRKQVERLEAALSELATEMTEASVATASDCGVTKCYKHFLQQWSDDARFALRSVAPGSAEGEQPAFEEKLASVARWQERQKGGEAV